MASSSARCVDGNAANPPRNVFVSNIRPTALATDLYAAILYEDTVKAELVQLCDLKAFSTKADGQSRKGLALTSLEFGRSYDHKPYYLGVFTEMPVHSEYPPRFCYGTESFFMEKFHSLKANRRLLDLDVSADPVSGRLRWSGGWGGDPVEQHIIKATSFQDLVAQCEAFPGMRLRKVQTLPGINTNSWVGLLEPGLRGSLVTSTDWSGFKQYSTHERFSNLNLHILASILWNPQHSNQDTHKGVKQQFIFDKDWGSLTQQIQTLTGTGPDGGMRLSSVSKYHNAIDLPAPKWDASFHKALDTDFMGYAYGVLQNGGVGPPIATGAKYARGGIDSVAPFTNTTRMNLASVSKPITAVAMMKILNVATDPSVLDQDFFPMVKRALPGVTRPESFFHGISVRDLLRMESGLDKNPDGTGKDSEGNIIPRVDNVWIDDIYDFLTEYLNKTGVDQSKPNVYNNNNFSLCQVIVNCIADPGTGIPSNIFATYVQDNVLKPMGIDTENIFNADPTKQAIVTRYYSSSRDKKLGDYFPAIGAVAAGGFISNVDELLKFANGLQKNIVLDPTTTELMLTGELGWYSWHGLYGQYFVHNGELQYWEDSKGESQGMFTALCRLSNNYFCVLLVNSLDGQGKFVNGIPFVINAFEERGL